MPTAWRLVRSPHAAQAFDGEGARLYPGRWNSPGVRMVYTADSPALAALEILVQIHGEPPDDRYVLIAATFPERTVTRLDPGELPQGWATYPAAPALRILGDTWIARNTSLVLAVPSAVIPEDGLALQASHHHMVEGSWGIEARLGGIAKGSVAESKERSTSRITSP